VKDLQLLTDDNRRLKKTIRYLEHRLNETERNGVALQKRLDEMEGIVVALQKDLKERSTPIPERLPRLGPNESLV
jgi:predicted  nucleic acid-binding Zn-ribbon protein